MSLRVAFFGTAPLAAVSLEALLHTTSTEVVAVATQPDRPQGRSLKPHPSPVKQLATAHGLSLFQPQRARDPGFTAELSKLRPDLIVVAAYGQILPRLLLEIPQHGCLNVHASLLPKYRGAAPIQWAILNGESETGVTIMKMDEGLDTGDIVTQRATPIEENDDALTLHARLAQLGAELLVETIPRYIARTILPQKQPAEGASYARKISRPDGQIDWNRPAVALWNQVRALLPWPGCFTHFGTQTRPVLLKVWQARPLAGNHPHAGEILQASRDQFIIACGTGALQLISLQLENGRRLGSEAFLAGHRLRVGDRFFGSIQAPSLRVQPG